MLRSACAKAAEGGERAAWVDGVGRVGPGLEWGRIVLARPRSEKEALECTEELLLCGGFAVVVHSGEGSVGSDRVRLCKAAREGGSALVEISGDAHMAALRIQGRLSPESFRWRMNMRGEPIEVESVKLKVKVTAGGWIRESEIELMVREHEHTLSLGSELADRRGVNR